MNKQYHKNSNFSLPRIVFLTLFSLIISIVLKAQCDHQYYYAYSGKITKTSSSDSSKILIYFPSSVILSSRKEKQKANHHLIEYELSANKKEYYSLNTLLGPCQDKEKSTYLKRLFIDSVDQYEIRIKLESHELVRRFDINEITFIMKVDTIVIKIPEIAL